MAHFDGRLKKRALKPGEQMRHCMCCWVLFWSAGYIIKCATNAVISPLRTGIQRGLTASTAGALITRTELLTQRPK